MAIDFNTLAIGFVIFGNISAFQAGAAIPLAGIAGNGASVLAGDDHNAITLVVVSIFVVLVSEIAETFRADQVIALIRVLRRTIRNLVRITVIANHGIS